MFHNHSEAVLNFYSFLSDRKRQGALYVQVEPKIRIGLQKTARDLPLDSIRCQTVMAKNLGPLSTWESKLLVTKNSGYNLLHFTPIQVCFNGLRLLSTQIISDFVQFRNWVHPDRATHCEIN